MTSSVSAAADWLQEVNRNPGQGIKDAGHAFISLLASLLLKCLLQAQHCALQFCHRKQGQMGAKCIRWVNLSNTV